VNGTTTLRGLPTNVTWNLRDISGRLLTNGMGAEVDFTGLPEGIYFIQTNGWGTKKVLLHF